MHPNSMKLMKSFRDNYLEDRKGVAVLDVGAGLQTEGDQRTYREVFSRDYKYIGMDIVRRDNVDVVVADPFQWNELTDWEYPIVVNGQMLEHCERFWQVFEEMVRVLQAGGLMCLIAPRFWAEHRFPVDCWRFLPDGMRALASFGHVEILEAFVSENDCVGIFRK